MIDGTIGMGIGSSTISFGNYSASAVSATLIDKTFSLDVSFSNVYFHDGVHNYGLTSTALGDIFVLDPSSAVSGPWSLTFDYNNAYGSAVDVKALVSYTPGASIAAVPEPETYAMMLAGLGALGFVGRRRKTK